MIINEGKNRQIEINKKPPNPVGTEEENRSASRAGYYLFAFLFRLLRVAGQPRFRLVLQDQSVRGQTIVGRDHWVLPHCGTSYRASSHCKSSYCRLNHCQLSHWKYSIDERKDNRLFGKKLPNPVGAEEENRSRKLLVSCSIFRCDQWYIELDDDHIGL